MLLAFTVRPFVNLNSSPIAETLIVNPFGDGTKSRSTADSEPKILDVAEIQFGGDA